MAADTPALAVRTSVRAVFNAPNRAQAEHYLKQNFSKYAEVASRLADWMESSIPKVLTVFDCLMAHLQWIQTSNMLKRVSHELKTEPG